MESSSSSGCNTSTLKTTISNKKIGAHIQITAVVKLLLIEFGAFDNTISKRADLRLKKINNVSDLIAELFEDAVPSPAETVSIEIRLLVFDSGAHVTHLLFLVVLLLVLAFFFLFIDGWNT